MPRLTNTALGDLGRQYRARKTEEKKAKAAAEELRDSILAELERRRVDKVEVDGVRLTRKSFTTRVFDVAALKASLSRRLADQVLRTEVNVKTLDALVADGEIDEITVKEALERTDESNPYVTVTLLTPGKRR